MKKNPWSVWAVAVVMAAALAIGLAGNADARLGGGMRLPVDDTVEVNGLGANHQVSDGIAAVRRVGLGLIKPVLGILPDDWEWLRLPVYQTAPND
jgi:hypothetical protein